MDSVDWGARIAVSGRAAHRVVSNSSRRYRASQKSTYLVHFSVYGAAWFAHCAWAGGVGVLISAHPNPGERPEIPDEDADHHKRSFRILALLRFRLDNSVGAAADLATIAVKCQTR